MADKDVRGQIIESATKYFSKYGFHKTTMDEIAKNIHKAKGVLYYYFKSKEELFNEVLKQELGDIKASLLEIVTSGNNSVDVLTDYILARFQLMSKAVNYHETLKADFFEKYHFVADVREDFENFERELFANMIAKGKEEGYIFVKEIDPIVDVALMIINSIEIPLFLQDKYNEHQGTIKELITLITSSLTVQERKSGE